MKHMHKRVGLAHVLRRNADLYLCGHQHLSAYMKLSNHGNYRPKDEQRCLFAIIGNSSKLDQDEGDFDNDFDHGKEYQYEEKEVRKMIERPASIDDYKSLLRGEEATSEASQNLQANLPTRA